MGRGSDQEFPDGIVRRQNEPSESNQENLLQVLAEHGQDIDPERKREILASQAKFQQELADAPLDIYLAKITPFLRKTINIRNLSEESLQKDKISFSDDNGINNRAEDEQGGRPLCKKCESRPADGNDGLCSPCRNEAEDEQGGRPLCKKCESRPADGNDGLCSPCRNEEDGDSRGTFRTPDVLGKTQAEAEEILLSAQLYPQGEAANKEDVVITQRPAEWSRVGDRVFLSYTTQEEFDHQLAIEKKRAATNRQEKNEDYEITLLATSTWSATETPAEEAEILKERIPRLSSGARKKLALLGAAIKGADALSDVGSFVKFIGLGGGAAAVMPEAVAVFFGPAALLCSLPKLIKWAAAKRKREAKKEVDSHYLTAPQSHASYDHAL